MIVPGRQLTFFCIKCMPFCSSITPVCCVCSYLMKRRAEAGRGEGKSKCAESTTV